jgi:hypothetical protein
LQRLIIEIESFSLVWAKVGKKVVNMSIDRTGGQYWLKSVNTGRLKILWSKKNNNTFFTGHLNVKMSIKVNS